jgi:flagellar hook-length control protein FliK
MPNIDFNQLSALPITDLTFPEPAASAARSNSEDLFNDYLKRADTVSKSFGADRPAAKSRDADRAAPKKAEDSPRPADHSDAAQPKSTSREHEASSESSSLVDEKMPSASESSAATPDKTREDRGDAPKTSPKNASEGESKVSERNAVKDKKKAKEEKKDAVPVAESTADAPTDTADVLVAQETPASKNVAETGDATKQVSVEADAIDVTAGPGGPASNATRESSDAARAKLAASIQDAQAPQEKVAAGDQAVADHPAETVDNVAGNGKSKSKRSRVAAADGKNAQRQQKSADNAADASVSQESRAASASSGKDAADNASTPSVASPAMATILPSVLDAIKNAEKTAPAQDAVGPIADARANSGTPSAAASTARDRGSAAAAAGHDTSPHVVRAQFVQRVERAFAAMGNREGTVRLKLSPPELGVLKLEIGIRNGVMKARVEAETLAAKTLLLDNLPSLRDRLAEQNIHVQQFDVELADRQPGGMPQHAFGQSDWGGQHSGRSAPRGDAVEIAAAGAPAATSVSQRAGMGGGLNVIV